MATKRVERHAVAEQNLNRVGLGSFVLKCYVFSIFSTSKLRLLIIFTITSPDKLKSHVESYVQETPIAENNVRSMAKEGFIRSACL